IADTRRLNLEFAGSRGHLPRLAHTIAYDQRVARIVAMVHMLRHVLIHLSPERRQQHAPSAFPHQLVQIELEYIVLRLFRSDYSQHAAYLSFDGPQAVAGPDNQRVRRAPHTSPDPQLPVIAPRTARAAQSRRGIHPRARRTCSTTIDGT